MGNPQSLLEHLHVDPSGRIDFERFCEDASDYYFNTNSMRKLGKDDNGVVEETLPELVSVLCRFVSLSTASNHLIGLTSVLFRCIAACIEAGIAGVGTSVGGSLASHSKVP